MTTSPFGTPGTAPTAAQPASAPPVPASRKPLFYAVTGVVVVGALGAGAYLLLGSGAAEELDTSPPAVAQNQPAEPGPGAPVEQEQYTQSSRNPFAAQVVEGGGGVAPTVPEAAPAAVPAVAAPAAAAPSASRTPAAAPATPGATSKEVAEVRSAIATLEKQLKGLQAAGTGTGATKAQIAAVQTQIDALSARLESLIRALPVNFTLRDVTGTPGASTAVFGWFAEGKGDDYDAATEGSELLQGGAGGSGITYVAGFDVNADGAVDYATVLVDDAVYRVYKGESIQLARIG